MIQSSCLECLPEVVLEDSEEVEVSLMKMILSRSGIIKTTDVATIQVMDTSL
jgi:hypothetical protein